MYKESGEKVLMLGVSISISYISKEREGGIGEIGDLEEAVLLLHQERNTILESSAPSTFGEEYLR